MEWFEIIILCEGLAIVALTAFVIVKDSECQQRKQFCARMQRECDEWQRMYRAEQAKNRQLRDQFGGNPI